MKQRQRRCARQHGFSLIEVLVTVVVTAFGLLGLAGFAARATALTADGAQRARASALLRDMTNRIDANRGPLASQYASRFVVHGRSILDCSPLIGGDIALLDLCEWNNLLAGANEMQSDPRAQAAHFGFRGCIIRPNDPRFRLFITVTWGSIAPGTPPVDRCATGDFGDDVYRRAIRSEVWIADLT